MNSAGRKGFCLPLRQPDTGSERSGTSFSCIRIMRLLRTEPWFIPGMNAFFPANSRKKRRTRLSGDCSAQGRQRKSLSHTERTFTGTACISPSRKSCTRPFTAITHVPCRSGRTKSWQAFLMRARQGGSPKTKIAGFSVTAERNGTRFYPKGQERPPRSTPWPVPAASARRKWLPLAMTPTTWIC